MSKEKKIEIPKVKNISIEGVEYKYTIDKTENKDGISITLSEVKKDKDITFTYQASSEKIIKDIKYLKMGDNLVEQIDLLKAIFNEGEIEVEKKEDNYIMNIEKTIYTNKKDKYRIILEKHEPVDKMTEILLKLEQMEKKYEEIKGEIENLKLKSKMNEEEKNNIIKDIKEDIDISEKIKEILKDKEIKDILFKEFEKEISKNYMKKDEEVEKKVNELINEKYSNKNGDVDKKMKEINKKIKEINENIKNEINKNINENEIIKQLNEKNKDNYITLKIEIDEEEEGKDIIIINQCSTYKLFKNFEIDDIEVQIDGEIIPIKYKNSSKYFRYKDKSVDSGKAKKLYKDLSENNYSFYWNFPKKGIYNIKIIFKKQLSSCEGLFCLCGQITEINISKFDCTKVLSCYAMFFQEKINKLKTIDLGELDFSLVSDFTEMFCCCNNLINLDVTHFETINSKSFKNMFYHCEKLEKIDVSKFNTSQCENINGMFYNCSCITEIDMIKWDMSNLKYENEYKENPIGYLFCECKKLTKIKIRGYLPKYKDNKSFERNIFKGINEKGVLIKRKNEQCNIPLDGYLPLGWNRIDE